MRESRIIGPPHNPGAGGWPTIRYFNKETGLAGANYVKKTNTAMCDELGNLDNMKAYIMEAGGTSFCKVENGAGCDDREVVYIAKMKEKTIAERKNQLDRLLKMEGNSMKKELKQWLSKRKAILKHFAKIDAAATTEL